MTVKIIHTADLHIGKSRTFPDYLERQSLMLDGIYKVAADRGINIVLMAGDIFESKNIKWNEQMLFISKLFEYDNKGFTTVVCNGNHDELSSGVSHMWLPSMIQSYGGLKHTHIVDGDPKIVELADLEIAVIPVVNNNMSTQELKETVEGMYGQVSGSKPFVVMLHATISGANTDIGYNISGGPRIPELDFVDYWSVGDIHKCFPQDVNIMVDYDKCCTIKEVVLNEHITHVLSYDLGNKRIEKRKILNKRESEYSGKFTRITLENKATLKSTHDHKYWVVGKGEVSANELTSGDKLIKYHGNFDKMASCYYCGTFSLSGEDAIAHSKTHDKDRDPLSCTLCDRVFSTREEKGGHYQLYHKKYGKALNFIKCEECGDIFKKRNLEAHKFFHKQESLLRNEKIKQSLLAFYNTENGRKNREHKKKICVLSKHRDKIYKIREGYKLSKGEFFIDSLGIEGLQFTGDGKFWIPLGKGKDYINKNPDFVLGDFNNRKSIKKVVEVFGGMGYFHFEDEIEDIIQKYKNVGIDCLVIDDRRLSTRLGREEVRAELECFCNNNYIKIKKVHNYKRKTKVPTKVYSIEVEENNNFFALAGDYPIGNRAKTTPTTPVLVMNCQQIGDKAWYSGSPIQHNFGDAQPKGVLVVDVEQGEEPTTELVELDGIKPLVTITEKPEVWPTDCYIRYLGPLEGIIELPANVIKTEGGAAVTLESGEVETEQIEFTDSLTEGLDDFLAAKSVPEEYRKEGIDWILEKYAK